MTDYLIGYIVGAAIGMFIFLVAVMIHWKLKYGKWWL